MGDKLIAIQGATDNVCDDCGCDLRKYPPEFAFLGAVNRQYFYVLTCSMCGSSITKVYERAQPWFDDEEDEEDEPEEDR